ncbi:hypothetical protein GCM10020331_067560 [Ectobacillus funiculus]
MYSDALNHYRDAYTSFKDDSSFFWKSTVTFFAGGRASKKKQKDVFQRLLQLDPTQVQIEELLYNLEDLQ